MSHRPLALLLAACALLAAALWAGCSSDDESTAGVSDTPEGTPVVYGATDATIQIGSGEAAVGQEATVLLEGLGVTEPGLGAWTINVAFDAVIVSILSCDTGDTVAACNLAYEPGKMRLAGATGEGFPGDTTLATVRFRCASAGTTPLTLEIATLADGTIGDPQNIDATVQNGEITCT
jgi:hypothetical protein